MSGIWKFYDWLPVAGIIEEGSGKTATYRSKAFASELGLLNMKNTPLISIISILPIVGFLRHTS
jgi:hypothetical protein